MVDFGDSANGDDNTTYDVGVDGLSYTAVDDESVDCDEDACGTSTTTSISSVLSVGDSHDFDGGNDCSSDVYMDIDGVDF